MHRAVIMGDDGGGEVVGIDGVSGWLEDECADGVVCVDGHIRSLLWCWLCFVGMEKASGFRLRLVCVVWC